MAGNTASGSGDALPVTAQTVDGVVETPGLVAANVLAEVAVTQHVLDRMNAKVTRAEQHAQEVVATAEEGHAQAKGAADAALAEAMDVLGTDDSAAVLGAAAELAAETDRHAKAMAKLATFSTDQEG